MHRLRRLNVKDIRTAAHKLQTDSSGNLLNKAIVAAKQD
jgi:hypothetical protein